MIHSLRLTSLDPSPQKAKKWQATFSFIDGNKHKIRRVSFGAKNYEDFTTHHDVNRRTSYRKRHANDLLHRERGILYWTQPGVLAMHLLWGDHTNLQVNLRRYQRMISE